MDQQLARMYEALKAADQAGDTAAATRLAEAIRQRRSRVEADVSAEAGQYLEDTAGPSVWENIGAGAAAGAGGMLDLGYWALNPSQALRTGYEHLRPGIHALTGVDLPTTLPDGMTADDMPSMTPGTDLALKGVDALGVDYDPESTAFRGSAVATGGMIGAAPGVVRQGFWPMLRTLSFEGGVGAATPMVGDAVSETSNPAVGALAELAFGVGAPATIRGGSGKMARLMLGEPGSEGAEVYDALNRLGVRPTVGLTGGRYGAYGENVSGMAPLLGQRTHNVQNAQIDQLTAARNRLQGAVAESATQPTPAPPSVTTRAGQEIPPGYVDSGVNATRGASKTDIGKQGQEIIESGVARVGDEISRREAALIDDIGAFEPVNTTPVHGRVDDMLHGNPANNQGRVAPQQRNAVANEKRNLRTMERGVPTYEADRQKLDRLVGLRRGLDPESPSYDADVATLDDLIAKQTEKMQVAGWDEARNYRSNIGRQTQGSIPLEAGNKKRIYETLTGEMERVAANKGVADKFDELMALERQSYAKFPADAGPRRDVFSLPEARRLLDDRSTADAVFTWLGVDTQVDPEKFAFLARTAGGEGTPRFKQFLADVFARMGRPLPGSVQDVDSFNPVTFLTKWNKLDNRVKNMISNGMSPDMRQQLDDLARVSEAFKKRGAAANPSGTTTAAILAETAVTPARVMANTEGRRDLMREIWDRTVGLMTFYFGQKAMLSPSVARSVAGRSNYTADIMSRYAGRTAGMAAQQGAQEGP